MTRDDQLRSHPSIADRAVLGRPANGGGETFVVSETGAAVGALRGVERGGGVVVDASMAGSAAAAAAVRARQTT